MKLLVNDIFTGKTILEFLNYYSVGKKTIHKLKDGLIVNGKSESLDFKLVHGDMLYFDLNILEASNIKPYPGAIDILYEDEDILIVDKPASLLVHPDGNATDTLANRVSFYYQSQGKFNQAKHIHRLDYDTRGIVVFTKHFLASSFLGNQLEEQKIKRLYIALCHGKFRQLKGTIDKPLARNRHNKKQRVTSKGKKAITKYRVLENGEVSKVEVEIITGRKHQIRVHMASINHPILGDKLYGLDYGHKLMLYASKISFIHPRTLKSFSYSKEARFGF